MKLDSQSDWEASDNWMDKRADNGEDNWTDNWAWASEM